ncbi:hypothetical protein M569_10331 [Genlisea aurea]|uniref:Response regulatory domain-containing protein n=1 Tax=Genlisea aurea TaxID=192259 RepID=S8CIG6_9LAMI|nr:hypothetical protein M569_10331 [Genlisea aurea]
MDSGSNSTSTNSEINANSSRNLQFLAVESSPRSLSELTTMLVKANYEGKTCTTLDRAFKLVQDKPSDGFDFLVCDSVSALRQLELVELISSKFDVIVVVVLRDDEKLEPATEKRLKDSECYCCTVAESSGLVEMIPLLVSGKRNPPAASSESKTQSDDAVVESSSVHKKKRLVWDPELNSRFLRAIQQLESNSKSFDLLFILLFDIQIF